MSNLLFALVLVATSALTLAGVVLILGALKRPRPMPSRRVEAGAEDAAFLFDGDTLVDCNPPGAALLEVLRGRDDTDDRTRLIRHLSDEFPTLAATLADPASHQHARLTGASGRAADLLIDWRDGCLRLTLTQAPDEDGAIQLDRLSFRAMRDELALLRRLTEAAPLLIWREAADGSVIWANSAYLERATAMETAIVQSWPLPTLFSPAAAGATRRICLPAQGRAQLAWYDVTRLPDTDGILAYATAADDAQHAERSKRDFVQTLTKTFATLPIGLAVFDRTRRLQVFNPALTDLTGLEPEFLLSRPGIEGFLNRLRDKHILPEPRDYRSWSKRLLDIETSALAGTFEETWSLPHGQTFRVSANPHPDGALAFLIEDITSETHLTRNVRAEMDTTQSVLNALDDAIAVFAPNGQLVLTNTAFSNLWTLEGEDSLTAFTLSDALANWREASVEPQLWDKVARLAATPGERNPVRGRMRLLDGETLTVEALRTSTGALMVSFDPEGIVAATPPAQTLRVSA